MVRCCVIVQYLFDGDKNVVKPVPHGNAKKNNMKRTKSTKEKLHVAVSNKEPRQVLPNSINIVCNTVFNFKSQCKVKNVYNAKQNCLQSKLKLTAVRLRLRVHMTIILNLHFF